MTAAGAESYRSTSSMSDQKPCAAVKRQYIPYRSMRHTNIARYVRQTR